MQDSVKQQVQDEHDKAIADKMTDKQVVWSGSSVGLIKSVENAEDVVNQIVKDCITILQKNAQFA